MSGGFLNMWWLQVKILISKPDYKTEEKGIHIVERLIIRTERMIIREGKTIHNPHTLR